MALTNKPRPMTVGYRAGIAAGTPMEEYTEGATQSWKDFAPVILSSGKLVESTSPLSSTNKLVGFANGPATGVTDKKTSVVSADDDVEFEATLSNSTAGTATLAQTDVGLIYPITKDPTFSTGFWYLDKNAAATDGLYVTRLKDAIGTVDGRVYGKLTRGQVLGG